MLILQYFKRDSYIAVYDVRPPLQWKTEDMAAVTHLARARSHYKEPAFRVFMIFIIDKTVGEMKKVWDFLNDFSVAVRDSKAYAFAASAAFFMFLSFIPVVMLIGSILPYTNLSITSLSGEFSDFIPVYVLRFIDDIILEFHDTSIALVSATAIILIWVSGKGFWALMNGLNSAYRVDERRNFFKLRLWGSFYTLLFIMLIIFTLVTLVYGRVIADIIISYIPALDPLFEFLLHFRYIYGLAFFTLIFMFMYTFIPNVKLKLFAQVPGALFSAGGWMLIAYLFSVYIDVFGGFSMYGSLTTIVIMLIWLYYNMYIIILGAIINQFFKTFMAYVRNIVSNSIEHK